MRRAGGMGLAGETCRGRGRLLSLGGAEARGEAGRMQLAQRVEVRRAGQGRGGVPEARTGRCQWRSP